MDSNLKVLLRQLSQYNYWAIGSLYLVEYEGLLSYVKKMSIDPIKAHLISIEAICKSIRKADAFSNWKDLVAFLRKTAKSAGEQYMETVPLEDTIIPMDISLDQSYHTLCISNEHKPTTEQSLLQFEEYKYITHGQFEAEESLVKQAILSLLQDELPDYFGKIANLICEIAYMVPRFNAHELVELQKCLSDKPENIQSLIKDQFMDGTNLAKADSIPDLFSLGFNSYELHKVAFLHMAENLEKGWPFVLIYHRLSSDISKIAISQNNE
ncbi:hypothetical protein ACQKLP_10705 [Chitinophaga sp. NPDC101104]|uniref:hypothetical protein n=1 Tax=Chitinophaga sp. NPDC101104 TaxID=3390561 RepID=UPI003D05496A